MLKNALLKRNISRQPSRCSVRAHNSFSLFDIKRIDAPLKQGSSCGSMWYQYTRDIDEKSFSVMIEEPAWKITSEDLVGYDNTGNVCIWASEEVMAHYCLSNRHIFAEKAICELGGGSSSLAGVVVAKHSTPSKIVLSDGNIRALANIKDIVAANFGSAGKATTIRPNVKLIRWDDEATFAELMDHFDYVLCADCLFVDGTRLSLAQTVHKILKDGGTAFVFAPRRAGTLEEFLYHARNVFGEQNVMVSENYDEVVWGRHQNSLQHANYNEDIHYPLLLVLKKKSVRDVLTKN